MKVFQELCRQATKRPWSVGGDEAPWIEGPDKTVNVITDLIPRGPGLTFTEEDWSNATLLTIGANHLEALVKAVDAFLESTGDGGAYDIIVREQAKELLAQIEKEAAQ